ncbi:hypothetical protein GQ44DRAFT_729717 [Phaeosphaeriaceae sp. PMI808]|nr:hypothetical protein GQ44DRAFT_729717 [Phaeosphaeriaceae sp. PMI808]
MHLSHPLLKTALFLLPLALLATTWLYTYPYLHACAFPLPPPHIAPAAPFRLLALADPQLEGDSSLPDPHAPVFPALEYVWQDLVYARSGVGGAVFGGVEDIDGEEGVGGKREEEEVGEKGEEEIVGEREEEVTEKQVEEESEHGRAEEEKDSQVAEEKEYGILEEEGGDSSRGGEVVEVLAEAVQDENKDEGEQVINQANEHQEEERGDIPAQSEPVSSLAESQEEERKEGEQNINQANDQQHEEERHDIPAQSELANALAEENQGEDKKEDEQTTEHANEYQEEERNDIPAKSELANALVEESQREEKSEDEQIIEQLDEQQHEEKRNDILAQGELVNALAEENQGEEKKEDEQTIEHANEHQDEYTKPKPEPEPEPKPLRKPSWGGTTEVLGADKRWANRVINIAGNHDVGYAGDLDQHRIERFEKAFGSVNWDIWFTLPQSNDTSTPENWEFQPNTDHPPPVLRVVVLNSMNIDAPAWNTELQTETYSFMNHIITTSRPVEDKTHATILLTHIPLEKQPGICVDSPYFKYFDEGQGLREQNMLSPHASRTVLEGMFGMSNNKWAAAGGLGRRGIVLNGHDHEGCDVVHFIRQDGVDYECSAENLKSKEAYWPKTTPTTTQSSLESPTGTIQDLNSAETSSPDQMNFFTNSTDDATSPAIVLETPTEPELEPEPEPEPEPTGWLAQQFPNRPYSISHDRSTNTTHCTRISSAPHLREITLRSMMGEFSGHAGFLSAWFDPSIGERGEWVFEFASCSLGVQHWWWAVHSIDFSFVVMLVLGGVFWVGERLVEGKGGKEGKKGGKVKGRGDGVKKGM